MEDLQLNTIIDNADYMLAESVHTKKGTPLYVLHLKNRVEDKFKLVKRRVERIGGYYSGHQKGFVLNSLLTLKELHNLFKGIFFEEKVEIEKIDEDKDSWNYTVEELKSLPFTKKEDNVYTFKYKFDGKPTSYSIKVESGDDTEASTLFAKKIIIDALKSKKYNKAVKDNQMTSVRAAQVIKSIGLSLSEINEEYGDLDEDIQAVWTMKKANEIETLDKVRYPYLYERSEMDYLSDTRYSQIVFKALEESKYQSLIKENVITANKAAFIIESAGFEIPESIMDDAILERQSEVESLVGGFADSKSIFDIANKFDIPVKEVIKQFRKGLKVEREHTKDKKRMGEIVKDHLFENPYYYDVLLQAEKNMTEVFAKDYKTHDEYMVAFQEHEQLRANMSAEEKANVKARPLVDKIKQLKKQIDLGVPEEVETFLRNTIMNHFVSLFNNVVSEYIFYTPVWLDMQGEYLTSEQKKEMLMFGIYNQSFYDNEFITKFIDNVVESEIVFGKDNKKLNNIFDLIPSSFVDEVPSEIKYELNPKDKPLAALLDSFVNRGKILTSTMGVYFNKDGVFASKFSLDIFLKGKKGYLTKNNIEEGIYGLSESSKNIFPSYGAKKLSMNKDKKAISFFNDYMATYGNERSVFQKGVSLFTNKDVVSFYKDMSVVYNSRAFKEYVRKDYTGINPLDKGNHKNLKLKVTNYSMLYVKQGDKLFVVSFTDMMEALKSVIKMDVDTIQLGMSENGFYISENISSFLSFEASGIRVSIKSKESEMPHGMLYFDLNKKEFLTNYFVKEEVEPEPTKKETTKEDLQARLRVIGKMIAKNPENKAELEVRARVIEKMIARLGDGVMAKGGVFRESIDALEKLLPTLKGAEKKQMIFYIDNMKKLDEKNKSEGKLTIGDLYDKIDEIKKARYVEEDGVKIKLTPEEKIKQINIIDDIIEREIKKDYPDAKFIRNYKKEDGGEMARGGGFNPKVNFITNIAFKKAMLENGVSTKKADNVIWHLGSDILRTKKEIRDVLEGTNDRHFDNSLPMLEKHKERISPSVINKIIEDSIFYSKKDTTENKNVIKFKGEYYLLSNDEIKEGDWFYWKDSDGETEFIAQASGFTDDTHIQVKSNNEFGYGDWNKDYARKIISTNSYFPFGAIKHEETKYFLNQMNDGGYVKPSLADMMADKNERINNIREYSNEKWGMFSQAVRLSNSKEGLESMLKTSAAFDDILIEESKNLYDELFYQSDKFNGSDEVSNVEVFMRGGLIERVQILDKDELIGKKYKEVIDSPINRSTPAQWRLVLKSHYNAIERLKKDDYKRINEKSYDEKLVNDNEKVIDKIKYLASIRLNNAGNIVGVSEDDLNFEEGGDLKTYKNIDENSLNKISEFNDRMKSIRSELKESENKLSKILTPLCKKLVEEKNRFALLHLSTLLENKTSTNVVRKSLDGIGFEKSLSDNEIDNQDVLKIEKIVKEIESITDKENKEEKDVVDVIKPLLNKFVEEENKEGLVELTESIYVSRNLTFVFMEIYKLDNKNKKMNDGGNLPSNKITLKPIMVNNYRWYLDTLKMEIYEDEEGTKSKTSVSKMTSQEREQVYDQMFHDKPMITFDNGGDMLAERKKIFVDGFEWYLDKKSTPPMLYHTSNGNEGISVYSNHFMADERKEILDYIKYGKNKENGMFEDGGGVKKDNTETILWAVKIGEPDWNEVMITNKSERIEGAKKWASENGFDRLRVSTIDLNEKPDFTKTIKRDGGGVGEHTITFDKDSLNEYKRLYNEAVENKHNSFVHKGNLQDVNRAKRLIDRFEKEFSNSISGNKATIPYKEIYSDGGGIDKSLRIFIGKYLLLKELPQLRFDKPNVKVGNKYKIIDVDGSNFWIIDDSGDKATFGSSRFDLDNFNDGGDIKNYPYENKDILVLVIDYAKMGVKQQASIQFNNGKIFINKISVDYKGVVEIPDNFKTMEDVVDFIYEYSYSPKSFVKINSVKYPHYISENTTHLIEDLEATNKIKKYLESKIIKN